MSRQVLVRTIVDRLLGWSGITSAKVSETILEMALEVGKCGQTERVFRTLCEDSELPEIRFLARPVVELLFHHVVMAGYTDVQTNSERDPMIDHVFPYRMLWTGPTQCLDHASIDRFVAKINDPIWQFVTPPNGWWCGCGVTPMIESEALSEPGINFIVSPEVALICVDWINHKPDCLSEDADEA